jgi:hypothetical protein
MPGVQEVIRVTKPYKLVSRDSDHRRPGPSGHCRAVRDREPRASVQYCRTR